MNLSATTKKLQQHILLCILCLSMFTLIGQHQDYSSHLEQPIKELIHNLNYDSVFVQLEDSTINLYLPQNENLLLLKGKALLRTEQFQQVLLTSQYLLEHTTKPNLVFKSYLLAGEANIQLNNFNAAKKCLKKAQSVFPQNCPEELKFLLSAKWISLYLKENNLLKARNELIHLNTIMKSIQNTTFQTIEHITEGDVAAQQHQFQKASNCYKKAIHLAENLPDKHFIAKAYQKYHHALSLIRPITPLPIYNSGQYPISTLTDYYQVYIYSKYFSDKGPEINVFEHPKYTENYHCIAIGKQDVVYTGNDVSLSMYRGNKASILFHFPQKVLDEGVQKETYALETDNKGKVYAGGKSYFGYITKDENGTPGLVPISNQIDSLDFEKITHIGFLNQNTYFCSPQYIIEWNATNTRILSTQTSFRLFNANEQLWVWKKNAGLFQFSNGQLKRIENGEKFAYTEIQDIVGLNHSKIIVATKNSGLFLYENRKISLFGSSYHSYIAPKNINCAINLENGKLGIGTNSGLLIVDDTGKVIHEFNKENGLKSSQVNQLYKDKQQTLWVVLKTGIYRIEYPNPLINFSQKYGLNDSPINTITEHDSNLYIGTKSGLKYTNSTSHDSLVQQVWPNAIKLFKTVANIDGDCRSIASTRGSLFIASSKGIYELTPNNKVIKHSDLNASYILVPSFDSTVVYVGLINGLASLKHQNGNWGFEKKLTGFNAQVNSLEEDNNRGICIGTTNTIWRFIPNQQKFKHYPVETNSYNAYKIMGQVFGQREIGASMKYDEKEDAFTDKSIFPPEVFGELSIDYNFYYQTNRSGEYYYINSLVEDHFVILNKNVDTLFSSLNRTHWPKDIRKMGASYVMYYDRLQRLWLGFQNGDLYCYNGSIQKKMKQPYQAYIRSVLLDDTIQAKLNQKNYQSVQSILDYPIKQIRFDFAALAPDHNNNNEYWTWLEGFESKPSGFESWSNLSFIQYNNLPEGNYTFHLRARNNLHQISEKATYHFKILSPWYRTLLAYIIYSLLFVVFIVLLYQWQSQKQLIKLKAQQTEELKARYEEEKREQEKEMYQMQSAQMQLKALRSQMNPHFTFNAMSAIQNLILKGKRQEALQSISDFSRILRKTLDHSDIMYISLKEEIDFIQSYLEVEKLRFESKFGYRIEWKSKTEPEAIFIPSMLIQPYVENAVKHGLLHKYAEGKLLILLTLQSEILHCTIEDNGIGREAASKTNVHFAQQQYQSKGMSITQKRLELINNLSDSKVFLHITDLTNEQNQATGTRIELKIPVKINAHYEPEQII